MLSGWISTRGTAVVIDGTHFEHVGPEHLRLTRSEVIRVVLHERRPARASGRHGLQRVDEGGRLPVALPAEAVAVGHQPLHGEARQLTEATEILEVRRERAVAAVVEELAQPSLDAAGIAQRLGSFTARSQLGSDVVGVQAGSDDLVDGGVGYFVDARDEVVHPVRVHRDAEAMLRLDLVTFGDGDVAHVVAEAHEAQVAQRSRARSPPRSTSSPDGSPRGR